MILLYAIGARVPKRACVGWQLTRLSNNAYLGEETLDLAANTDAR